MGWAMDKGDFPIDQQLKAAVQNKQKRMKFPSTLFTVK